MNRRLLPTLIALVALVFVSRAGALENAGITIDPDQVKIDFFYGGQNIAVRADMPAGYDGAVIKVTGKSEDLELKKKGKKGGLIWMNVGEVGYHEMPSVLLIKSSRPFKELAPEEALGRFGIGYAAIEARIPAADKEARELFGELIKLKEHAGLFAVDEKGLEIASAKVSTNVFLPPKAPPGEYQVEVFGFRDGNGALLGSGKIRVDFTPSTAFISNMAVNHGLLYGCLASAIAILAGLLTGYIFGGKGGSH